MKLANGRMLVGLTTGALALVSSINPVSVQAQSQALRVKIPFEFHVGAVKLPAGTYIVQRAGEAIWVNDGNGHTATVLSNAIGNRAAKVDNQLVFNRYLDDCFLSEVRWSEYSSARGLSKSSLEKQYALKMSPQQILSAALTR